jgi:hypothetical protein
VEEKEAGRQRLPASFGLMGPDESPISGSAAFAHEPADVTDGRFEPRSIHLAKSEHEPRLTIPRLTENRARYTERDGLRKKYRQDRN